MLEIRWSVDHPQLIVGLVQAEGVRVAESGDALLGAVAEAVERAKAAPSWPPEPVRAGIRDLLRRGGFKPTGRSKPASEYLAKAALEGSFPSINNLVDINNLVSLRTGWPCSIIDIDRACPSGEILEVRYGRAGETFVFNAAGQSIDVAGLVCLARAGGEAIANPVKDSMATKTCESTSRVLLVAYVSTEVSTPERVRDELLEVQSLFEQHATVAGGKPSTSSEVLSGEGARG